VAGCLVGLVALVVNAPAAAAPRPGDVTVYPNGVTVDSQGRVDYNVDLSELPGAVVVTEQGVRIDDECEFKTEQEGMAGNASVLVVTELSFDPNTCTRNLARAEYASNLVPANVRASLDKNPDFVEDANGSYPDHGGIGTQATWSASLKVNVEDPPQIDVTTTHSFLTWNSRGGSSHTSRWGWFRASGWGRVSHSHNHYNGVTFASTNTVAHYRNGIFCATIDTHTYHDQTYWRGHFNGAWYWSYRVRKSGGCTGLLHYEYIVDRP
jgi:hypothetical protein